MLTNYSFKNLATDLSDVLSEIPQRCLGFDSGIIDKITAAKEWAEAGQYQESTRNLYSAYHKLAKDHLTAIGSNVSDDNNRAKYLFALLSISFPVKLLDTIYSDILHHGLISLKSYQQSKLKADCEKLLRNEEKFRSSLIEGKTLDFDDFDFVKEFLQDIIYLSL
jgi:1,2-phenylacetyl-CoA epoxidase catalytic subunit